MTANGLGGWPLCAAAAGGSGGRDADLEGMNSRPAEAGPAAAAEAKGLGEAIAGPLQGWPPARGGAVAKGLAATRKGFGGEPLGWCAPSLRKPWCVPADMLASRMMGRGQLLTRAKCGCAAGSSSPATASGAEHGRASNTACGDKMQRPSGEAASCCLAAHDGRCTVSQHEGTAADLFLRDRRLGQHAAERHSIAEALLSTGM